VLGEQADGERRLWTRPNSEHDNRNIDNNNNNNNNNNNKGLKDM
jgi:hypothetical protein